MDFDAHEITLRWLLETILRRSTSTPEFLNCDGTDLAIGWDIGLNGRPFGMCQDVDTILKDGNKVVIHIELLGCG